MQYEELKSRCDEARTTLLHNENLVRGMKDQCAQNNFHDQVEVLANLTLAIRHIEDARMRLGKAIQHGRDGVSIFDQGKKPDS